MLRLGICTPQQFIRAGSRRRFSGSRASYSLLNIGENPTREQIEIFEDISFTLRTSNGTCRTTFRGRLLNVDAPTIEVLKRHYPSDSKLLFEDRAVSHGLTSLEWAQQVFQAFPNSIFEASDRLLYLIQLSFRNGEKYILEPDGQPLQYIKPPFVVSLAYQESTFSPIHRIIASHARRRLGSLLPKEGRPDSFGIEGCETSQINCVHPEVRAFIRIHPQFQFRARSVFEITPTPVHVLRTMNIFNRDYFSELQLKDGADAAHRTLKLGGVWIVGRTLESDFSNHATILQRLENGWKVLARIGNGSEMEGYAGRMEPGSCIPANND